MLLLLRIVHILAIAAYFGGTLFLIFIFSRAQNSIPPSQGNVIGQRVARDFAILTWVSIILIGITGVLRLHYGAGMLDPSSPLTLFLKPEFLEIGYGRWLVVKIGLWVILVINGLIMLFLCSGPLQRKLSVKASPEDIKRRLARFLRTAITLNWLFRASFFLSLAAIIIGAWLIYGGPF